MLLGSYACDSKIVDLAQWAEVSTQLVLKASKVVSTEANKDRALYFCGRPIYLRCLTVNNAAALKRLC